MRNLLRDFRRVNRRGIKRCFCLTSVCLPVAYIGRKSRTERSRKTKIGTESHVTRTPLSRSKVQRSRSPGRFTHRPVGTSGSCSGGRGNVLAVRNCCYIAVCSAARGASVPTGRRGAGHIVAAAHLQLIFTVLVKNEGAYLQIMFMLPTYFYVIYY